MTHISLISAAAAVLLTGCGHHVVYNQVVTSEARLISAQTTAIQQPIKQALPKHQPQPQFSLHHHNTEQKVPITSLRAAMPTPTKQPPQLILVPISMLNKQGFMSSSQHQGVNVPMIRIPMLVMSGQQTSVKQPTQTITQETLETSQEYQE